MRKDYYLPFFETVASKGGLCSFLLMGFISYKCVNLHLFFSFFFVLICVSINACEYKCVHLHV
jgi:hypothetical protein